MLMDTCLAGSGLPCQAHTLAQSALKISLAKHEGWFQVSGSSGIFGIFYVALRDTACFICFGASAQSQVEHGFILLRHV